MFSLYSALVTTYLDYIKLRGSQYKEDTELLERVQRRLVEVIRAEKHLSFADRLRELRVWSLEKRRL